MENILVLTNPIELADVSISYGLKLAEKLKAGLEFIYIIDTDQIGWHPPQNRNLSYPGELTFFEFTEQEAERIGDILTKKIDSLTNDTYSDLLFKVEKGTISEILKREGIKKNNLILLVCHSINITDYNGVDAYLLTREIKFPVWIVYPGTKDFNIENIIYASSGDIFREMEALAKVFALAELNGSSVTIAFSEENFLNKEQKLKNENIFDNYTVYKYSKLKELIGYSESRSNLIAVMEENKSFFREITSKDKTHKLIEKSRIPVLVFHAGEIKLNKNE